MHADNIYWSDKHWKCFQIKRCSTLVSILTSLAQVPILLSDRVVIYRIVIGRDHQWDQIFAKVGAGHLYKNGNHLGILKK